MNNTTPPSDHLLLPTVFLAGVGTLGIEMVMPRLIAPFFGTSQPIWAVVIGMTLIYLSIGYKIGGVLADRFPNQRILYQLILWAGFLCGLIPILSRPILTFAQQALNTISASGFLAALVAVILLFAAPVILLATVAPFAIRIQLHRVDGGIEAVGRTAGTISSLSTVGSIVGTFMPVLVLVPWIGTQRTIYVLALFLLLIGFAGLRNWRYVWMIIVVGIAATYTLTTTSLVKAADCEQCRVIVETESSFNYIQVVQEEYESEDILPDWRLNLVLNEGHAIHSSYRLKYAQTGDPLDLLTSGPWDYFAVAPYFFPERKPESVKQCAILGAAVGTIPTQLLAMYGLDIHVDGVEIDPHIIQIGRDYFDMGRLPESQYIAYLQDARYWLATTHQTYDLIGMDAYHQPYIPFHLTTVEFFQQAKAHLNGDGVVVVNAGRPPSGNDQLENALASTMRAVFPQVFIIDTRLPRSASALVVGVNRSVGDGVANFKANAAQMTNPALREVMTWAIEEGARPVREFTPDQARFVPFTDDHAPIEQLVDSLILNEVTILTR